MVQSLAECALFERFTNGTGVKATAQRLAVCQTLEAAEARGDHKTAEEINTEAFGADSPPVTTYRTLRLLQEMNLVTCINIGDGRDRFEIAKKPHGHLVNRKTGEILEFDYQEIKFFLISKVVEKGMKPDEFSLVIFAE